MSMKGTCCCCFVNNARSLILLLSFFCIISLFANTILLNFTIIHNESLIPKHFLPLSQKTYGLPPSETPLTRIRIPPTEAPLTRIRRQSNFNETEDSPIAIEEEEGAPVPMEEDEFSTQALISELQSNGKVLKKKPEIDVDEGYPIPSVDDSSIEKAFEAATYPPTVKNTRLILLTKATVPGENVNETNEGIKEAGYAPLIATTTTSTTAATFKGFSINVKDTVSAIKDGEEKTALNSKEKKLTDYSGVSFFDRSINDEIFDGLFFVAPGIGMLLSHIFSSILLRKVGCHRVILVCLLISAISTAAIPFLISYGHNAIIGIRVIQGITFGPVFNFIGKNAVAWASLKEQLWFLCTCISALILTPIISWSFTNEIINDENFNLIFYLHGTFAFVLSLIWLIFYRDTPQKHRWVNGLELNKVMTGKAQNNRIMEHNVFSTIFKSIPVFAIWIAAFGYFCAFALFITFLPIYANSVIHLIPYQAGSFAILPFALMAFVHWLSYLLNKWLNVCGLTLKVRLYNTVAFVVCAILFVGLAISAALHHYSEYSTFVNFVHFSALFSLGFAINGFFQSSIVVGRYYSQYLISHMMIPFSLAFIFVPIITVFFTPLNLLRYWRLVFLVIAVVLLLSAVIFAVFGRGQPTIWAETSWDPTSSQRMLSSSSSAAAAATHFPIDRNAECGIIHMKTVDDYYIQQN
uniref:Major facilitator superfamily (MFS) profile domain-containing protein n=1 Tax=Panagrolaimus sp. PS1159 TaxID=55785 RepID=A0AC35F6P8_9BILA